MEGAVEIIRVRTMCTMMGHVWSMYRNEKAQWGILLASRVGLGEGRTYIPLAMASLSIYCCVVLLAESDLQ
jgi:hypothetical protein